MDNGQNQRHCQKEVFQLTFGPKKNKNFFWLFDCCCFGPEETLHQKTIENEQNEQDEQKKQQRIVIVFKNVAFLPKSPT